MSKPTVLTPDALAPSGIGSPAAATTPRGTAKKPVAAKPMPLQIRLSREDVRAIKIAAAEREQTISDFMLACFHAYMKARKHDG
jgi:hypothetical protein